MKKCHATYRTSIRFRRFERRGYAVFCSLHKQVSIGRMSVLACDSQLRKSGDTCKLTLAENSYATAPNHHNDTDDIATTAELAMLETQLCATTLSTAQAAAAAHTYITHNSTHTGLRNVYHIIRFSVLFLYANKTKINVEWSIINDEYHIHTVLKTEN